MLKCSWPQTRLTILALSILTFGCSSEPEPEPAAEEGTAPASAEVSPDSQPEVAAPAPVQEADSAAPTSVNERDRILAYASVIRAVLGNNRDARSGVVVDPEGLAELSPLGQRKVLIELEDVAPEAVFGTQEEVLENQKDRVAAKSSKKRGRKEPPKTDRGSSSTASTPPSVTEGSYDDEAPTLVIELQVRSFVPGQALIKSVAWLGAEEPERSTWESTGSKERWTAKTQGPTASD